MLNRRTYKLAAPVIASMILLSGCGLFGKDQAVKEIDPPQDVSYLKNGESLQQPKEKANGTAKESQATETVKRELYLIDKNGFVVPQTLSLPKTDAVAKQALEYLVQGGPIEDMLPNGFRAVLPADTRVLSVNLQKDGTIVADFSPEFAHYKAEDEKKILQAITWTLTQFDNVKKVKIRINGHDQTVMPVDGTPIQDGVSREDGINIDTSNVVDITNTRPIVVYFVEQQGEQTYYVPVTRRISNEQKDDIAAAVNELIKGPKYGSGLVSDFQPDVQLIDKPVYKDGKVTLNFNDAIYGSNKKHVISEAVLNSLVLSLTEQKGIESVSITVNGKADLVKEDGKALSEPVTRPENVNTGSF
ncbi:GerMN domain-containing protein [Anoxybacillus rupiensis]|jgi:germination protein M|uniref:GerMN domain-containing protein n=1 Tax=Anoxybacteroides rupiense TaxID=311460 RepID=A0ABD5IS87_9BACL|nr:MULTISPECIES: GerMN domain-containing protein [Anoxybacillus]KXG11522.1 Spore germination protein GerM [Anoxybacillus sp. P3H1B]MBB3907149.1 germination protein M [Anoxybacillus rupiensis]MBS2771633.1 GerMN domain-containing protein [Anoxybacillus rupiensis]MDE8562857.1 GerMN domain-containing protein [Anoxybacillus rupiensis]MED5051068.1 GerMN domain-containing protein [Anoxybacillus rupiensis]